MPYFDDNFGSWDGMDDPDMVEFYHQTQRKSVVKTCRGCGRKVKILPQYDICDSCATRLENGLDLY